MVNIKLVAYNFNTGLGNFHA